MVVVSGWSLAGSARESPATSSGWFSRGVPPSQRPAAVWLNRSVIPPLVDLEVGMPTAVSQIV